MNFNTELQAPNAILPFTMPKVQQLSFSFYRNRSMDIMDTILIHFGKTTLIALQHRSTHEKRMLRLQAKSLL